MLRLLRLGIIPLALLVALTCTSSLLAKGKGCRGSGYGYGGTPDGCPPYWCDSYANLNPWPYDNPLVDGPRNWSWWFPYAGFTAYPGLPGSGIVIGSDYSHINWTVPPVANANQVVQKLQSMGIPLVPQETIYLGKIPKLADKAKLPIPKNWLPEEKEKNADKELNKDK